MTAPVIEKCESFASEFDQPVESKSRWFIWGVFLVVAVVEFLLYQHYFLKRVSPYYPVCIDQVVTYLYGYWAHYQLIDKGILKTMSDQFFWHWADPMKGPALNHLATVATFAFGPSRFSIASINLLFLISGQFALLNYLWKRSGIATALLGSSLFLFLGSHYLGVGGINDLRRDYGCMIISGITFFAVCDWIEIGTKKTFWLTVAALFASAAFRSVVLFYWLGASMFLLIFFSIASRLLKDKGQSLSSWIKRTAVLLAISFAVICSNILGNLSDFWTYYLSHKVDGEELMRWREFGVHNIIERFFYYPNSFLQHFNLVLKISFAIALVFLFIGFCRRSLTRSDSAGKSCQVLLYLCIALTASAMAVLTFYSPNPIVIGFEGMILCTCLATLLHRIQLNRVPNRVYLILSLCLALSGIWYFAVQLRSSSLRPHGNIEAALTTNRILVQVKGLIENRSQRQSNVYWVLVHDGLNDRNFDVYWYEEARRCLPVGLRHLLVPYFPESKWETVQDNLDDADIVVAPTYMNPLPVGGFEYPGNTAVRKLLPQITSVLAQDFRKVGEYNLTSVQWRIGVFERCTER